MLPSINEIKARNWPMRDPRTCEGAQLSEVLTPEVSNSVENTGFSRRRVVAGVAWSLPVIVTAVAAPAAAASGLGATAGLVGAGSAVSYVSAKGIGSGTNPTTGRTREIRNPLGLNGPFPAWTSLCRLRLAAGHRARSSHGNPRR